MQDGEKKTTTIAWLIKFIGDHQRNGGYATRADIISNAVADGHDLCCIQYYLGSAALYGHVDPADCDTVDHKVPRRAVYFRRPSRARYVLSPLGVARYRSIVGWPDDDTDPMTATFSKLSLFAQDVYLNTQLQLDDHREASKSKLLDPDVKASKPGYNAGMELQPSNFLHETIMEFMSDFCTTYYLELVERDEGYSYEDTLHLCIEAESMPLMAIMELGEELGVPIGHINIEIDGKVLQVTLSQHLSEAKFWLQHDPYEEKGEAPYPGMEFEVPDPYDHNVF